MSYTLTKPAGIASLTLSGAPPSRPQFAAESNRLLEQLPPEVGATIRKHEAEGTCDDPEYIEAVGRFYDHYVAARHPQPEPHLSPVEEVPSNPEVYLAMNGPLEFQDLGTLKDWDIRDRLVEIDVPTLVTSGRFDIITADIAGTVHEGIRGSEWVVFEESAHMAHLDEPDRYRAVLAEFLARHEP